MTEFVVGSGYAFRIPPGWVEADVAPRQDLSDRTQAEERARNGGDDDELAVLTWDALIVSGDDRIQVVLHDSSEAAVSADEAIEWADEIRGSLTDDGAKPSEATAVIVAGEPGAAFDYFIPAAGQLVLHRHAVFGRKGVGFFVILSHHCGPADMVWSEEAGDQANPAVDAFDAVLAGWEWHDELAADVAALAEANFS